MKDKRETEMADWVTSLLAATGQCCIAGTDGKPSGEEEEEVRTHERGKQTDHVKLLPGYVLPQAAKHNNMQLQTQVGTIKASVMDSV